MSDLSTARGQVSSGVVSTPPISCCLSCAMVSTTHDRPAVALPGWHIRITPVGPDVEIRPITGPPGNWRRQRLTLDASWPVDHLHGHSLGTRTSIEPQVSRWRLISSASQLAAVRSSRAAPKPVLIVVSAANCQPDPSWRPPSVACSTSGLASRREARASAGPAAVAPTSLWRGRRAEERRRPAPGSREALMRQRSGAEQVMEPGNGRGPVAFVNSVQNTRSRKVLGHGPILARSNAACGTNGLLGSSAIPQERTTRSRSACEAPGDRGSRELHRASS